MSEIISIPILELMEKTEQWLLNQGYKKNTLGVYKATWNKFRAYSSSPFYDRETAEKFLLRYFGVDVNAMCIRDRIKSLIYECGTPDVI